MLEWLKRHAWKACKPLKGFAGSNPALSAIKGVNQAFARFTPFFTPKNVKLGVFVGPSCKADKYFSLTTAFLYLH